MGTFAQIPIALLDDERLQAVDLHVYGILLSIDVDRDGVSLISHRRLGERIRRDPRAAQRSIKRLEAAGWLQTLDHGNGNCRSYRLTTLPTDGQGIGNVPSPPMVRVPSPKRTGTLPTGVHQPITLSINERTLSKKDDENQEALQSLVALLDGCDLNGKTEIEARKILKAFPDYEDQERFMDWLRYATNADGIRNPIGLATSSTKRGEDPPRLKKSHDPWAHIPRLN